MRKRSLRVLGAASLLFLGMPGLAAAQDGSLIETDVAVNSLWIILGAILVLFMQAGFLLLETGLQAHVHRTLDVVMEAHSARLVGFFPVIGQVDWGVTRR